VRRKWENGKMNKWEELCFSYFTISLFRYLLKTGEAQMGKWEELGFFLFHYFAISLFAKDR
jgi:hypothetical protein